NPSDAHSGAITVDGTTISYAGLEPVHINAPDVTINGVDSGPGPLKNDLLKVGPGSSPGTIEVHDFNPLLTSVEYPDPISELHSFLISTVTASTGTVTINGGEGSDTVEFIGDYIVSPSNLVVNAEKIKVDAGVKIDVGTGNITFNAVAKDNGLSL